MSALLLAVYLLSNEFPLLLDMKPIGPWCGPSVDVQLTLRNRSGRTLWLPVERSTLPGEPVSYSYTAAGDRGGGSGSGLSCGGPSLTQRLNSPSAVRLDVGQEVQWMTTLDHFPVSEAETVRVYLYLPASPDRLKILHPTIRSGCVRLYRDPRTGCLDTKRAR